MRGGGSDLILRISAYAELSPPGSSNGDLPVGVWRAFRELCELGWVDRVPRMVGRQQARMWHSEVIDG